MGDNPNALRFLRHVHEECSAYDVQIQIAERRYLILDKKRVFGYFTPPEEKMSGALRVAGKAGLTGLFHPLVHEFGHFLQWKESADVWHFHKAFQRHVSLSEQRGITILPRTRAELFRAKRNLEHDCELRALALINTWKLPIDTSLYVQYANAHIWWYTLRMERAASGLSDRIGSEIISGNVLKDCPTVFLADYDHVPHFYRDAFDAKI